MDKQAGPGADRPKPLDVASLERSLNDSATRVSTIWISFLIFALYLATTVGNVTDRQILLQEPVKLPVLNIELPLYGFFLVAPALFVIFHAYVVLQVLLLARTAEAYNGALDYAVSSRPGNALYRQRLANTLFAQLFAGSPRERSGAIGVLLKLMAWITLVIAPIIVLLLCEVRFLAYHAHVATWSHRLLILLELIIVVFFWPLVLNPKQDPSWRTVLRPLSLTLVVLVLLGSVFVLSFPEEVQNRPFESSRSAQSCERWLFVQRRWDRLELPRVSLADQKRVQEIEAMAAAQGAKPHEAERTRNLRGRDLRCANLESADLRAVDLSEARLDGANLSRSDARGGAFVGAHIHDADLSSAKFAGATFEKAGGTAPKFEQSQLGGAIFKDAYLPGANFKGAKLFGADLNAALLTGADFSAAQLMGATLRGTYLEGANLTQANLSGASLEIAQLQGALLLGTNLQAASLDSASVQGADFRSANLRLASLNQVWVWRATNAGCEGAVVLQPSFEAKLSRIASLGLQSQMMNILVRTLGQNDMNPEQFITAVLNRMPESVESEVAQRMRKGLIGDKFTEEAARKVWTSCLVRTEPEGELQRRRLEFLRGALCGAHGETLAVASGIYRGATRDLFSVFLNLWGGGGFGFPPDLAKAVVGTEPSKCPGLKALAEQDRERIVDIASRN